MPKSKKPLKRKFERINGISFCPQFYPHMWITYCNILPAEGAYPLPYLKSFFPTLLIPNLLIASQPSRAFIASQPSDT